MDHCFSLGIDQHRHHVALAPPGLLIMITLLFWVAVMPLILYLAFLGVLVALGEWFKK